MPWQMTKEEVGADVRLQLLGNILKKLWGIILFSSQRQGGVQVEQRDVHEHVRVADESDQQHDDPKQEGWPRHVVRKAAKKYKKCDPVQSRG